MENKEITQHITYLKMSEIFAQQSYCVRKKVGSLIVKDNNIISSGYNGTPAGTENVCENIDGETHWYTLHSEANAITKLAKSTLSSEGAILYLTLSPCKDCAKLILQSGIKEIYYLNEHSCHDGLDFLTKNNIKCYHFNRQILQKRKDNIIELFESYTITLFDVNNTLFKPGINSEWELFKTIDINENHEYVNSLKTLNDLTLDEQYKIIKDVYEKMPKYQLPSIFNSPILPYSIPQFNSSKTPLHNFNNLLLPTNLNIGILKFTSDEINKNNELIHSSPTLISNGSKCDTYGLRIDKERNSDIINEIENIPIEENKKLNFVKPVLYIPDIFDDEILTILKNSYSNIFELVVVSESSYKEFYDYEEILTKNELRLLFKIVNGNYHFKYNSALKGINETIKNYYDKENKINRNDTLLNLYNTNLINRNTLAEKVFLYLPDIFKKDFKDIVTNQLKNNFNVLFLKENPAKFNPEYNELKLFEKVNSYMYLFKIEKNYTNDKKSDKKLNDAKSFIISMIYALKEEVEIVKLGDEKYLIKKEDKIINKDIDITIFIPDIFPEELNYKLELIFGDKFYFYDNHKLLDEFDKNLKDIFLILKNYDVSNPKSVYIFNYDNNNKELNHIHNYILEYIKRFPEFTIDNINNKIIYLIKNKVMK